MRQKLEFLYHESMALLVSVSFKKAFACRIARIVPHPGTQISGSIVQGLNSMNGCISLNAYYGNLYSIAKVTPD